MGNVRGEPGREQLSVGIGGDVGGAATAGPVVGDDIGDGQQDIGRDKAARGGVSAGLPQPHQDHAQLTGRNEGPQ